MKKLTEGLIIAVSVLGMLGCSSNGSSSSSNDSGGGFTGITKALLLNQDGGNGLGLWSVLDSNLSSLDANYTTSGVPVSDPNDIFNAGGRVGVGGDKTGFSLNPADGNFYAVMTGSLEDSNEPLGAQSYNDSLVVKFDPRTDALEVVTKIPEFNKDTYEKPMSRYTLKPVISPDGKSLLAFATVGGKVLPTTPANPNDKLTSGGVVHIDIDPTSPTYGSAHLVFEFADYSINSLNWEDNIHTVRTEPLFFDDGNASVFLGSEYLEIYDPGDACGQSATNKNCIVSGKLFCITPTDDSNWSQPWVMRSGMYRHSSILGRTAHYETSDKSIWIVEERNGFDVVAVKLDTDGNEDPSWNQGRIINNVVNGTLYPQAVIGIDIQSPLVWTQGSQAVAPTLLTIRENSDPVIDSVAGYTGSNTLPVHLAKTKWSQKIWVNAASMTDPSSFDSSIQFLKETHPYGSADYSKSLQQLWDEHYVAESTLKKIDRTSGASIKIFSGSAANGNFLAGAPALSDDFSYS
ncbi:MAG: hypothetical protein JXQ67_11370, partial [Campylobacterales bacterium]|nr:hypothetical protein [Campylobacterales bacterium]